MHRNLPQFYFYIPEDNLLGKLPQRVEDYWQWVCFTENLTKYTGRYSWTLETYLYLKDNGFPCQIVGSFPKEGIVLTHRDFLPDSVKPQPKLLIICCKAERPRHPYAQIHIVQNPCSNMFTKSTKLWRCYYMPIWQQAGLIPRDSARGEKFENVASFGYELAPELKDPSWQKKLEALGFHVYIKDGSRAAEWDDHSYIDVIVSVRNFKSSGFNEKPAHKLYNAWFAGLPAILGSESAFQAERKNELDYIEVNSLEEIITALKRLRYDKELRYKMVENGKIRAQEVVPAIIKKWEDFLINVAVPAYNAWCKKPNLFKKIFIIQRFFSKPDWKRRLYYKIRKIVLPKASP